jgi:hypothetical protein
VGSSRPGSIPPSPYPLSLKRRLSSSAAVGVRGDESGEDEGRQLKGCRKEPTRFGSTGESDALRCRPDAPSRADTALCVIFSLISSSPSPSSSVRYGNGVVEAGGCGVPALLFARDGKTRFIREVIEGTLWGDLEIGISTPETIDSLLELERMTCTLFLRLVGAEGRIFGNELVDPPVLSFVGMAGSFIVGWFLGGVS